VLLDLSPDAVLAAIPRVVTREDYDLRARKNREGLNKAMLTEQGLQAAGRTHVTASAHEDSANRLKPRSDRISTKGPVVDERVGDESNHYGGAHHQVLRIKTRKIERARLRGKPDAQHLTVQTPAELKRELNREELRPGDRQKYKNWVDKDREHHVRVASEPGEEAPRGVIAPRFLHGPGFPDLHDSDSDSDSAAEVEDEAESSAPAAAPRLTRAQRRNRNRKQKKQEKPDADGR
jgi:hypothetical protein